MFNIVFFFWILFFTHFTFPLPLSPKLRQTFLLIVCALHRDMAHRQCLFTLLILYCCRAIFQPNSISNERLNGCDIEKGGWRDARVLIMLFYPCRNSHNFPHGDHFNRIRFKSIQTLSIDRHHHRCCHLLMLMLMP